MEPKYSKATEFINGYALVYDDSIKVINEKCKVVKKFDGVVFDEVSDLSMWLINGNLYTADFKKVNKEDIKVISYQKGYFNWYASDYSKSGIMNKEGKIVYTYDYKKEKHFSTFEVSSNIVTKENYCIVNIQGTKNAIVNCDTGKVVLDYINQKINAKGGNIFEIYKENSYALEKTIYVEGDKIVYTGNDKASLRDYSEDGYIKIYDGNKSDSDCYSYYDLKTKQIVKEEPKNDNEFETLDSWEEYTGYKKYEVNDKVGLMSGDKIVLEASFKDIDYLYLDVYKYLELKGKKYILVKDNDNNWSLYDMKKNQTVFNFKSEEIKARDSLFIYYKFDNVYHVYNIITGKTMNTEITKNSSYCSYDICFDIQLETNYLEIRKENEGFKYYNKDMEVIYTETY